MTHRMKRGDRHPALVATLGHSGEDLDLTSATIRFKMTTRHGAVLVDRELPPGAIDGLVATVEWQEGETDVLGVHRAEFPATFPGGRVATFPNDDYILVEIIPALPEAVA